MICKAQTVIGIGSHLHGHHLPDSQSCMMLLLFLTHFLFTFAALLSSLYYLPSGLVKGEILESWFFKVWKGVLMWFPKVRLPGPDNFQHLYNQWAVIHKLRCLSVLLSVLLFSTTPGSFFFASLPWTVI